MLADPSSLARSSPSALGRSAQVLSVLGARACYDLDAVRSIETLTPETPGRGRENVRGAGP